MTIKMVIGWPDEWILALVLFVLVVSLIGPAITFIQSLMTGESQEEIKKREEEIRKKEHQQFIENQKKVNEQNKKKLHEALLELSDADFEKISSEIQNMSEEECIEQTGFGIWDAMLIYWKVQLKRNNSDIITVQDLPREDLNNIAVLPHSVIDEMEEQKHDLNFQYSLVKPMMEKGEVLAYPFHRVVILLTKEKRFREALDICNYVKEWCATAELEYDGSSAKHWLSPKLQNIIQRITKLQKKI